MSHPSIFVGHGLKKKCVPKVEDTYNEQLSIALQNVFFENL